MRTPVRDAGPFQASSAAFLIGDALGELGLGAWLAPDPVGRDLALMFAARLQIQHALTCGAVHMCRDGSAVAVWIHCDRGAPLFPDDHHAALTPLTEPYTPRWMSLLHAMSERHPAVPHRCLVFLAVRQQQRDRTCGQSVLTHGHDRLDTAQLPAFTVAASLGYRDYLVGNGYLPHGDPIRLAGSGISLWPLWRDHARPLAGARAEPSVGSVRTTSIRTLRDPGASELTAPVAVARTVAR